MPIVGARAIAASAARSKASPYSDGHVLEPEFFREGTCRIDVLLFVVAQVALIGMSGSARIVSKT